MQIKAFNKLFTPGRVFTLLSQFYCILNPNTQLELNTLKTVFKYVRFETTKMTFIDMFYLLLESFYLIIK